MILSSTFVEAWKSGYMFFIAPGVLTWIGAIIWWAKRKTHWLPIILQGIGILEVALGGVAAYFAGEAAIGTFVMYSGTWDPSFDGLRGLVSMVALVCWGTHWILMVATFITMFMTHRRIKEAQQAAS
jgi:hypothetical protein